ncbi:hemerythrin domain-containing protein [Ectothiorhodospiraceae bacterium WFHF3C12]|nr:hemerythrin domain-containing protein [Ectothiorhodospiraceae bacterium WFHF3C12]
MGNDYDAELIHTLQTDHQELLSLFGKMGRRLQSGDYAPIKSDLTLFKTRLESHLLTENYRLYAYLEDRLSSDPENSELMRDFRKEMREIAKDVMGFIRTYTSSGVNEGNVQEFERAYKQVGERLKQRIAQEERNLYPMYRPPSH